MTFWQFADRQIARLPGWPSERQAVTAALFFLAWKLLDMAIENGTLWDVELFKIILQAVIIGAIIGSVIAFHFAANKQERDGEPLPVQVKQPAGEPVPVQEEGQ